MFLPIEAAYDGTREALFLFQCTDEQEKDRSFVCFCQDRSEAALPLAESRRSAAALPQTVGNYGGV
jgi:hypothetical protein